MQLTGRQAKLPDPIVLNSPSTRPKHVNLVNLVNLLPGFQMLFTSGLDVRVVFVGSQAPTLMDPAGQRKRSLALADSGLRSSEGLNYVELSLQTQHGNMENG